MKGQGFRAHEGPIWQISWADPSCGNLIASCSYDKSIKIWSEEDCKLINAHTMNKFECSVNCISWAPPECGIMLFAGLSSGNIIILKYVENENIWSQQEIKAHKSSVNAIKISSSSVLIRSESQSKSGKSAKSSNKLEADDDTNEEIIEGKIRFVSCSCDNTILEWAREKEGWVSKEVGSHDEWVRDVAWASGNLGLNYERIVSGGEDNMVKIWIKKGPDANWELESQIDRQAPVWRVGFNPMGNLLSVCSGDNSTSLYKEEAVGTGEWIIVPS